MHYSRLQRLGTTVIKEYPERCIISGCENKFLSRGLCAMHYRRMRLNGDPLIARRRGGLRGDPVKYEAAHQRIRDSRGKASEWPCAMECGSMAADWAYNHLDPNESTEMVEDMNDHTKMREVRFSQDANFYDPMCRSCHVWFDRKHAGQISTEAPPRVLRRRAMIDAPSACP